MYKSPARSAGGFLCFTFTQVLHSVENSTPVSLWKTRPKNCRKIYLKLAEKTAYNKIISKLEVKHYVKINATSLTKSTLLNIITR